MVQSEMHLDISEGRRVDWMHAALRFGGDRLHTGDRRSPQQSTIAMRIAVLLVSLLLASCDTNRPDPLEGKTVIDVLFVYTRAAGAEAGDVVARIDRALDDTHRAYDNSRIDVRLRRVHIEEVDYELTGRIQDLARLVRRGDGYLDEVHTLRDRHAADLVVLVVEERSATQNAAVMATPETAFAVVYYGTLGAPDYALAHEIGHLQGARHSPESGTFDAPFPYGHGTRTDAWKTIMATGSLPAIAAFSNPDVRYDDIPTGTPDRRNVARVLNETAVYVSNFRGPQTPTGFVPPATFPVVE